MTSTSQTRQMADGLSASYKLARILPSVAKAHRLEDQDAWAFEMEDHPVVVVGYADGTQLLANHLSVDAAVEHARAGHRTTPQGASQPELCALCRDGAPAGVREGTFTHPDYVAPAPAEPEPEEG